MRVGIDGWHLGRGRGLGSHTRNLVASLSRVRADLSLLVYVPAGGRAPLDDLPGVSWRRLPRVPFPLWEQLVLPLAARRDQVSVLHCPANTGPLRLGRTGPRLVVTVHDTIFMPRSSMASGGLPRSSDRHHRLGALYRRLVTPEVTRGAAAVITVSHASRDGAIRDLGAAPDRVRVVAGAPDPAFHEVDPETAHRRLAGLVDREPFILALGAIDPRKNTLRIISSFARYRREGGDLRLVIAGSQQRSLAALRHAIARAGVTEHVRVLGFVGQPQLVALYNLAGALLYPSLCEGFGLPVLEAMACGTPVITSSTTALPEVAGGAAILVDPRDEADIARALLRLEHDVALRREMVRRGRLRTAAFTWADAGARTAEVYASLSRPSATAVGQPLLQPEIRPERGGT